MTVERVCNMLQPGPVFKIPIKFRNCFVCSERKVCDEVEGKESNSNARRRNGL